MIWSPLGTSSRALSCGRVLGSWSTVVLKFGCYSKKVCISALCSAALRTGM